MVVSRTLRVDGRETLARLAGRTIIIDGCWVAELGRLRELGWKLELPSCPEASAAFTDRKSTRLNSSHIQKSRMPSSA